MKKLPLLLITAMLLTGVSAQAKTIDVSTFYKMYKTSQQMIKLDKDTIRKNILKRLGIDLDRFHIPTQTPKPTLKPAATAKPTAMPTQKPTAVPATEPAATAAPTFAPTAKPAATLKPTSAPTAKPAATLKPTLKPTTAPSSASTMAAMETEVLRLVNEERAKQGAAPLTRASDLDALARAHSQDMINRHFFDHNNPDGKSPFDRMHAAGITYRAAAENIAYGQTSAASVMNAWMNSSGHRKNILNPTYTEIGIGAVKNSGGTIYWTQEFVKR